MISVTDSSNQVQALTALLEQVIHSLDMAHYKIEDPTEAYNVEADADAYYQQMVEILHSDSGATPESVPDT